MKTKSFTLIELLVVIVIIGILAGVITLSVSSNISKAQDLRISSTILSISKALKADSLDSFPIETTACNLKNSCTTLKARIDLPNITEDIYYKTSSSGKFFVIYANKPSNTSLGYEITSTDENVKEVPSFDNLVAYYPLSAGTKNGTAISDMSPNSNNGTNYGASSATGADGNIGTAMSFDGTNDYIDCGNDESLKQTNELTVVAWINPSLLSTDGYNTIISTGRNSYSSEYNFWISNGSLISNIKVSSNETLDSGVSLWGGNIPLNSWSFVSFSYSVSKNTWKHYLNGNLVGSKTAAGPITSLYPDLPLTIGIMSFGAPTFFKFNGSINDVRIYNRALSQEEVTLLYNAK